MGDVMHHVGEEFSERAAADRAMERRVTHAGADDELAVRDRDAIERRDAVDIDEMRRPGEPERHGRHQALAAGEHAPVLGRDLGEQRYGLVDGFRGVVAKHAGFIVLASSAGFNFGISVSF